MSSILAKFVFQANVFDIEAFFSEFLYIVIQGILQIIDVLVKAFIFLCGGTVDTGGDGNLSTSLEEKTRVQYKGSQGARKIVLHLKSITN